MLFRWAAQTARFHFVPTLALGSIELARQGFDRDVVLRAESAPENKPLVELSGFV